MKILVLGATGMMGHMACRVLGDHHEIIGTTRRELAPGHALDQFLPAAQRVSGVTSRDLDTVRTVVDQHRPDAVINCIGIVKQLREAHDAILSIECNSLFPHQLAEIASGADARLIHLSTDCVFSGKGGNYTLDDNPDPVDLYGRTKLLGETGPGEALTLRTSIVGRQISGDTSFFEWILGHHNEPITGYARAIYSGLTTMALARIMDTLLTDHPDLSGTWQVASAPITKIEIIERLNDLIGLGLEVQRNETFELDRSLDGSAFAEATGIVVPTWEQMLTEFAADLDTYSGVTT